MINKKTIAKKLKKNGLINYDLRKTLTPAQKAVITRKWNEFGHYIDGDYIKRNVSKKRAVKLKGSGFKTYKTKTWLPTEGRSSKQIKIIGDNIYYISADKLRKIPIQTKDKFLGDLKKLSEKKLKPGEFVTVRIGAVDSPFWVRFTNYEQLLNYITAWEPDKDKARKNELIAQMSVVKFLGAIEIENRSLKRGKKKRGKNPRDI